MFRWIATVGLLAVAVGASAQIMVVPNAKFAAGKPEFNYPLNPSGGNVDVTIEGIHTYTVTSAAPTTRVSGFQYINSSGYTSFVIGGESVGAGGSKNYPPGMMVNDKVVLTTPGYYSLPPGEYFGKAKSTFDAHMDGSGSHSASIQFVVQPYG